MSGVTFSKAEARAIRRAVRAAVEDGRGNILTVGHGVRTSLDLQRAQLKIISAAAFVLGDEWDTGR